MSDTNTASELLITIKTLLDSQGLDAAKKELDKVIATGQKAGDANKDQAKEANLLKEILGQLGRRQSEVRDVAEGMAKATEGGAAGFFGMAKAANNLWRIIQNSNPWLRIISLILAMAAAIVALANKMKGAGESVEDAQKKANTALQEWQAAVDKINAKRFDELSKELKLITDGYTAASTEAERLYRIQSMLSKSKEEKELADLELEALKTNMPENQKAFRTLEIKKKYEDERFAAEETALKDRENRETETVINKNREANKLNEQVAATSGAFQSLMTEARGKGIEKVLSPKEIDDRSFGPDKEQKVKEELAARERERASLKWKSDARPFSQDLQKRLDSKTEEVAMIRSVLEMLPKLQMASEREKTAVAEFDKSVPALETEIQTGRNNLVEIAGQKKDLGIRRQTAAANYEKQYEVAAAINPNVDPNPPRSRNVTGLKRANSYEWEQIANSILPQMRDQYGIRHGGSMGGDTRRGSLELLADARDKVVAKSGDTKEDDQVIADLIKALNDFGTVKTMENAELASRIREIEKNTAEIRRRMGTSESREKVSSGLN